MGPLLSLAEPRVRALPAGGGETSHRSRAADLTPFCNTLMQLEEWHLRSRLGNGSLFGHMGFVYETRLVRVGARPFSGPDSRATDMMGFNLR